MKLLEANNFSVSIKKDGNIYKKLVNQNLIINEGDVVLLSGPNGSGKSSIIKSIVGDTIGFTSLETKGNFYYYKNNEKIKINENEKTISKFAGEVCYISQNDDTSFVLVLDSFLSGIEKEKIQNKNKYVFDFIVKYNAYNCFFDNEEEIKMNSRAIRFLKSMNLSLDDEVNKKTALFLTSKRKNLSGGQSKMLNILSNLIRVEFCLICLIDEPLNNLDYSNVRLFSNIISSIHSEYPNMAFLIVTHCRAIPVINRIVQIDTKQKQLIELNNVKDALRSECSSCFGNIENDMYI